MTTPGFAPGMVPSIREPSKLHAFLVSIFGASLIGFWVGEDLIADGLGNITSWPGRVGSALINATDNRFARVFRNGRIGFYGATSTGRSLIGTLSAAAKCFISVAEPTSTLPCPADIFPTLVKANVLSDGEALVGNSGTSNWYTANTWIHYKNGAADETITSTGLAVYQGEKTTASHASIRVGGYIESTVTTWDWLGAIMAVIALSSVPTILQRFQAQVVLDRYYRPTQVPISQLTLDLYNIFGVSFLDLWVGEDATLDGSNNVTSWVGRAGAVLSNGTAERYTKGTLEGRQAIVGPATTAYMTATVGSPIASIITVMTSPTRGTSFCVTADSPANDGSIQENTNVAFPSPLYTIGGWSHYVDGSAYENLIAGVHVVEGDCSTTLSTQFRIGTVAGSFCNQGPVSLYFVLSAIPTVLQRLRAMVVLDQYYRPSKASADQLGLDLYNVFGADLIGLWIGDDVIVDESNNVTSWPGRIGGSMARISGSVYGQYVSSPHKGMTFSSIGQDCLYDIDLGIVSKSVWAVATSPALPSSAYEVLAKTQLDNDDSLVLDTSSSSLLTISGWSHYIDGIASDTLTSGVHVLEGIKDSPDPSATHMMKGYTANYQWAASDYFRMALSAIPSAEQRAAAITLLKNYYGI